jgi:hypothetical protein
MLKSYIIGAAAALALTASAASAATLRFEPSDAMQTAFVKKNDVLDSDGNSFNGMTIDIITGDKKNFSNGLFLDSMANAKVTYTYLGFEAGHTNYSAIMGADLFLNKGTGFSKRNDTVEVFQEDAGLLQFAFGTSAPKSAQGVFMNNGLADPADFRYSVGYVGIDADSFYLLFDDIAAGDRDFDDLVMRVDVAAVPLPAGAVLLLSALIGAGALRRRQKSA